MNKETSRRDFLKLAGKGMLGAAALSTVPVVMPAVAEGAEAPAWPWAYKKLDKEAVMKHGYECFYSHGGCCAGAVAAVVELLAEEYGYPYNQLNARMFADGAGGYGAATLCGSLGGACAVFGLFCEANEARELRDQLYAWYKDHAFPTYQPEMESITTVSGAIECAVSVGNYMKATGYEMGDAGRKARCAAVTGETAAKAVELLNIHFGFEEAPAEEPKAEEALAENEYIGTAESAIGGEVKVKVTMDGDKIAKIDVLSHNETAGISDPAFEKIPAAIIEAQSADVDVVAGATKTSEALIAAVKDALSQVK